jgi:signal transduction histidine kinase
VYRLVQEGLTNALRHASGAQHVDVLVERRDDEIVITVEDDAIHRSQQMTGSGRGLAGLGERVALYGGSVDAGPRPGGGWRLHATLHAASDRTEEGA